MFGMLESLAKAAVAVVTVPVAVVADVVTLGGVCNKAQMSTEHSLLRSTIDSLTEANRLIARYDKHDLNYVFTKEDIYTLRGIAIMSAQAAKTSAECVEALLYR